MSQATAPGGVTYFNTMMPIEEKVCMWAETKGFKKIGKEITFEICGTQQASSSYKTEVVYLKYGTYDQVNNGKKFYTHNLKYLTDSFSSSSKDCPITEFNVYDSDRVTLLVMWFHLQSFP